MGQAKQKAKHLHEWSGIVYRKGSLTREGKFKTWKDAQRWVEWQINTDMDLPLRTITLGEICHVEKNGNVIEDVPVIRYTPGMFNTWRRSEMKKPWFEGNYQ